MGEVRRGTHVNSHASKLLSLRSQGRKTEKIYKPVDTALA